MNWKAAFFFLAVKRKYKYYSEDFDFKLNRL